MTRTQLDFSIHRSEHVRILLFDVSGRLIARVTDRTWTAGSHHVEWNGKNSSGAVVPGGIYFARMTAGTFAETRKVTHLP